MVVAVAVDVTGAVLDAVAVDVRDAVAVLDGISDGVAVEVLDEARVGEGVAESEANGEGERGGSEFDGVGEGASSDGSECGEDVGEGDSGGGRGRLTAGKWTRAEFRAELWELYEERQPCKLGDVDALVHKYFGQCDPEQFFAALNIKYPPK
jgi:hypothetical protein